MSDLLILIFEFVKTGLFAIGGGLATIPFLQDMAVKYGWFDTNTLSMMIAISESTPGPMGVNMATYVGYITHGLLGSIVVTLSLITPSIIIIIIIANMFNKFKSNKIVQDVFKGIRPFVVGLIMAACIDIFITTLFNKSIMNINWVAVVLFGLGLTCYNKFKLHPILIIILGGIIGVLFSL